MLFIYQWMSDKWLKWNRMFSVRQTEKQIDCRHIVELKKTSKWISDETERPDGKSDREFV